MPQELASRLYTTTYTGLTQRWPMLLLGRRLAASQTTCGEFS